MGNDANCQKFCDHKEQDNHDALSEIKMNQYPLQCQLCHKEVEHMDFKLHLDVRHYACIEQKNQQISVVCILCEKGSGTLADHQNHLCERHAYLVKKGQTPTGNPTDGNDCSDKKKLSIRQIKSTLRQVDTIMKVKIIRESDQTKSTVQYQGRQFQMYKYAKQYNGMDYDESQVFSELVLSPIILKSLESAKFYVMEKTPLQRTILCNSFILCDKS